MKRTILIATALLCGVIAKAQKAETVVSFIIEDHDPEWYAAQAEVWQKRVDADPTDEWAWRNLFRATNYHQMFTTGYGSNQDSSQTADIIRRMEKAVPDSYVLNLSKGRFCLSTDSAALRGDNIYRAIELMPEDAVAEDVDYLACRLWSIDPENPLVKELFTKSYEKRHYPSRIMHFNMNLLQSMQPNALYFANGDVLLAPMKILQDALGMRQDVTIVPLSYIHSPSFLKAFYDKFGIEPPSCKAEDYHKYGEDWFKHFEADIVMHIIKKTKRPTYFATDILQCTTLDRDSLYNEGLLLKYSPKQYDNFSVAMHNVEEVYHLEYLAEPDLVCDHWKSSEVLDRNCVTLLSNLVSKFRKKGKVAQADRLEGILSAVLQQDNLEE